MLIELVDLRSAIENDAVIPYFQPVVELRTGRVYAFEVLARWNHPELGPILPPNFISLAEKADLIGPMTWNLLRRAFQAAEQIPEALRIGVNLSALQFRDKGLPSKIRAVAEEAHFPLQRLTAEITESAVLDNVDVAREIACELKEMGCRVALDDFGTGFSSLAHLQAIPFDALKVDRSFIERMTGNRESRKIVAIVVGLGRSLGITTIAEGVETEEQADMLLRLGCRLGQGWLYGHPTAAEDLATVIAAAPRELRLEPTAAGNRGVPLCLQAMPESHQSQLHAIYEGAPVGLCFLDRDLRYVSINRRLAELNGAPIEAHLGRTPEEMAPGLFPHIAPYLYRALQGERMSDVEIERAGAHAGDPNRVILVSYEPAFDEAGEVAGVSVAVVDITELKRAEGVLRESDERYRSVMETSPVAMWVLDRDGNFIDASSPWFDMTGQTREDVAGRGFLKVVHPAERARATRVLLDALRAGNRIDIEFRAAAAGGGWRWMRVRGAPRYGPSGEIVRWYGTAEDTHARRAETESLRRLLSEMERCRNQPGCPGYCHPNALHQSEALHAARDSTQS